MTISKKIKIMTHLVAGYPSFSESVRLAETLASAGANILEVQIPFSEPVADGQTIVEACHVALKNGFRVGQIFDFCHQISKFKVPVVVMTYANPLLSIGIDSFCYQLKKVGVAGIIVPDLPFDSKEGEELREFAKRYGLNLIQVVSPSMNRERLRKSINFSENIIYCTTKRGTTGGRISLSKDLKEIIKEIRKQSDLTIALGFGISSQEDVRAVAKLADIVVVGSAIIREFNIMPTDERYNNVSKFLKTLIY